MEEEKQPKHKCNVCRYYEPFYIKKDTCFEKTKDGLCGQCKQIKNHFETCECWKGKSNVWFSRKWSTERVLKDLLFHLVAIRQILQEEKDERNQSKR